MKLKVLCTILLFLLCSTAVSAEFCHYPDANRLVWDKHFSTRVHEFLGERRENFFYDGLLYEQALAGLGGPPDEIVDIGSQSRFASACRAHGCDEKAAVVIACPDKVLAVGILHFDLRSEHFNPKAATLTIYSHKASPAIQSAFDAWRRKVAKANDIDIATDYREF